MKNRYLAIIKKNIRVSFNARYLATHTTFLGTNTKFYPRDIGARTVESRKVNFSRPLFNSRKTFSDAPRIKF